MRSYKFIILVLVLFTSLTSQASDKLTICWDVSLSMQNRNIDKEMTFLDSYFSKYKTLTVTVLKFNNVRVIKEDIKVNNGNWEVLKDHLIKSEYDGATGYNLLNTHLDRGTIFVFTDGKEILLRDAVKIKGKPYIVNSKTECDLESLKFLTLFNKGRFIDLSGEWVNSNKEEKQIRYVGNVFSPVIKLENLTINTTALGNSVKPDKYGKFQITANPGDVLDISANGKTLKTVVLDSVPFVNLWIDEGTEKLDEIVIKKSRALSEEEKEIETGLGSIEKKKVGYSIGVLEEDEIDNYFILADALRGRIPGVSVGDDLGNVQIFNRATSNFGSGNALVVIDGAPLARNTRVEGIVTPQSVASITVLKSLAATTLYGSEGRNGVISITTKAGARNKKINEPKNLYKGGKIERQKSPIPSYIRELESTSGVEEKYSLYLDQREEYWDHPLYFSDVYSHMSNYDMPSALQIAYNVLESETSSLKALRALLIASYKSGHYQLSLDIAYAILIQYPYKTQSYMDLAMAHKMVGNYQEALNRLIAITYGTANPALDFSGLNSIAQNEIRDLVASKGDDLNLKYIPKSLRKRKSLKTRIVVDWSDRDAEFVLTFISPDGLYDRWIHTIANKDLMEKEFTQGFSQKEFEIEGGNLGKWIININYLGNKLENDETPSLLKCVITHDYGTPQERVEQRVIRLYETNKNEQLISFTTK